MNAECPYHEGEILRLSGNDSTPGIRAIHDVRITHVYTFAFSCVMEVETMFQDEYYRYVLKLYDYRFASLLRAYHQAPEQSTLTLEQMGDFIASAPGSAFVVDLQGLLDLSIMHNNSVRDGAGGRNSWTPVQLEVVLHMICEMKRKAEVDAYERLAAQQGNYIPHFLSSVTVLHPDATISTMSSFGAFNAIRGILIEKIKGYPLSELEQRFPARQHELLHWYAEAVRIMRAMTEAGVLYRDVRPSNVILSPLDPLETGYRVVVVNFGETRLRRADEGDEEWNRQRV